MLTQADMDAMADTILAHMGGLAESLIIMHRTVAADAPVPYGPVDGFLEAFSEGFFRAQALLPADAQTVLRGDRQVRIATAAVTWDPTTYDEVVRENGETWRVQNVQGGIGGPWWMFHVRRIPTRQERHMPRYVGEQLILEPLADPGAPTLRKRGATGSTTYTYAVVGRHGEGHTVVSASASVTNGATTLTEHNYIEVVPPIVPNVIFFDIYRLAGGATQGKIGQVYPRVSIGQQVALLQDTGRVADGTTAPTENTTGQFLGAGTVALLPFAAVPTADALPPGRLGISIEGGVLSFHRNDGGTIKTISIGALA